VRQVFVIVSVFNRTDNILIQSAKDVRVGKRQDLVLDRVQGWLGLA
jgi:hypothetical protein